MVQDTSIVTVELQQNIIVTVHCYMSQPLCLFFSVRHFIEGCKPYVKMFSTLSGVRLVFWISPRLNSLCTSAVKNVLQTTIYHSCAATFQSILKYKTFWVVEISVTLISRSEKIFSKNFVIKRSKTLIIWGTFCYTAGYNKSGPDKRSIRPW